MKMNRSVHCYDRSVMPIQVELYLSWGADSRIWTLE